MNIGIEKNRHALFLGCGVAAILLVVIVAGIYFTKVSHAWNLRAEDGWTREEREEFATWGAFGDSMAPIAAFGAIVAIGIAVLGSYLQSYDILKQVQEMVESKEAQNRMAEAQEVANELGYMQIEFQQHEVIRVQIEKLSATLDSQRDSLMKTSGAKDYLSTEGALVLSTFFPVGGQIVNLGQAHDDWRGEILYPETAEEREAKHRQARTKRRFDELMSQISIVRGDLCDLKARYPVGSHVMIPASPEPDPPPGA